MAGRCCSSVGSVRSEQVGGARAGFTYLLACGLKRLLVWFWWGTCGALGARGVAVGNAYWFGFARAVTSMSWLLFRGRWAGGYDLFLSAAGREREWPEHRQQAPPTARASGIWGSAQRSGGVGDTMQNSSASHASAHDLVAPTCWRSCMEGEGVQMTAPSLVRPPNTPSRFRTPRRRAAGARLLVDVSGSFGVPTGTQLSASLQFPRTIPTQEAA